MAIEYTLEVALCANGNPVVEYAWGLLGPIARLYLQNPSNSRYYILDALGHTRLLLDNTGNITDTYVYDAWGNLLKGSDFTTPNPFTWNGAYGYEWIEFTGLFHVGAREYDPRTARWLQRDPIGIGGGHANVYLYCGNEPVNSYDNNGADDKKKQYDYDQYLEDSLANNGQHAIYRQELFPVLNKGATTASEWGKFILECFALTQAAKLYYGRDCSGQPLTPSEALASGAQLVLTSFGFGVLGAAIGHGDEAAKLGKVAFARGKLHPHFVKHGSQVGAKTAEEYLQKARDLVTRRHLFVFTHTTKTGDIYIYDALTNEFASLASDCQTLRTYYLPDRGWDYWLDQLKR